MSQLSRRTEAIVESSLPAPSCEIPVHPMSRSRPGFAIKLSTSGIGLGSTQLVDTGVGVRVAVTPPPPGVDVRVAVTPPPPGVEVAVAVGVGVGPVPAGGYSKSSISSAFSSSVSSMQF